MKTFILSILFAFSLLNCSTDRTEQQFVLSKSFTFSVKDAKGMDLLDPAQPNSFKEAEIKIYYKIDGKLVEVDNQNKDYPHGFNIFKQGDSYRIAIFLNGDDSKTELPETFIYWNNTNSDKVVAQIDRNNSNTIVSLGKVFLNNVEIWTAEDNKEPYYIIMK